MKLELEYKDTYSNNYFYTIHFHRSNIQKDCTVNGDTKWISEYLNRNAKGTDIYYCESFVAGVKMIQNKQ